MIDDHADTVCCFTHEVDQHPLGEVKCEESKLPEIVES